MWTTKQLDRFKEQADYYLPGLVLGRENLKVQLKCLIISYKEQKQQITKLTKELRKANNALQHL